MITGTSFKIAESGVRLDAALLAQYPSSTRSFCRDAVTAGNVTVNGRLARKGDKLRAGDTVDVKELMEVAVPSPHLLQHFLPMTLSHMMRL